MERIYLEWEDRLEDAVSDGRKFFVLVIYDIIDNKRRRYLVKVLEAFGIRVQKSAFECVLDRKRYDRLLKKAPRCIDVAEDSLRIYLLNGKMSVLIWGNDRPHDDDGPIIL